MSVTKRCVFRRQKETARAVLPSARSGRQKLSSQAEVHHALGDSGVAHLRGVAGPDNVACGEAKTLMDARYSYFGARPSGRFGVRMDEGVKYFFISQFA
jgi:hypothetical protein